MSGNERYTGLDPKEVRRAKKTQNRGKQLQDTAQLAALRAAERLLSLLEDPDASHGDVIKAAALVFERVYPSSAGGMEGGDYEICVKEE